MIKTIPSMLAAAAMTASLAAFTAPTAAQAQLFINIQVGVEPPPLPVYDQPPLPSPDYLWTPGYWAWDDDVGDYYWVPGVWVQAPQPGYLWTPPWWGWENGLYVFHDGYWGQQIGFYGGVNYGFGYTGAGYEGGYWNSGHFFYNTTVNRVNNVNITNVYQKTVVVNNAARVSFNGGPGGVQARATPAELSAARAPHLQPTGAQAQQVQAAHADRAAFATVNHGAPPVAATTAPGRLSGPGVVKATRAGGALPAALQHGPVGAHAASAHPAGGGAARPGAATGAPPPGQPQVAARRPPVPAAGAPTREPAPPPEQGARPSERPARAPTSPDRPPATPERAAPPQRTAPVVRASPPSEAAHAPPPRPPETRAPAAPKPAPRPPEERKDEHPDHP